MTILAKSALGAAPSLPFTKELAPASLSKVGLETGLPPSLSMTDLVSWLSAHIRSTDTAIRNDMAGISSLKDRQSAISHLTSQLRNLKLGAGSDGKATLTEESIQALKDMRDTMGPDAQKTIDGLLGSIEHPTHEEPTTEDAPGAYPVLDAKGDIKGYLRTVEDPPRITTTALDEGVKALGDAQQALSGESEIGMIRLQSAMSARGQLLSLVSNILASTNETAKGIVNKVGSA
ncbi:MAG: hypothetical protein JNL79_01140 [Myxococcales bacterium]|nr:hypothetical protein [Myxococcales bacterium]